MKPAPEQITIPGDLLRISARWVASALVADLDRPLAGLRAGVQASRRMIPRECPDGSGMAAIVNGLDQDTGQLERAVAACRAVASESMPRARLQPEQEIAAAVTLVTGSDQSLGLEGGATTLRATGHPGVIGLAVLHLLLCLPVADVHVVRVTRPEPSRLVVQVRGSRSGAVAPSADLHAVVALAAVDFLGGTLDPAAEHGPLIDLPLEL